MLEFEFYITSRTELLIGCQIFKLISYNRVFYKQHLNFFIEMLARKHLKTSTKAMTLWCLLFKKLELFEPSCYANSGIPMTDFRSFSATRNELGMMSSTQNS